MRNKRINGIMYDLTLDIETDNGTEEIKFIFDIEAGEPRSFWSPGYEDEIIDLEWSDCSAEANEFIKNEIDWVEAKLLKIMKDRRADAQADAVVERAIDNGEVKAFI